MVVASLACLALVACQGHASTPTGQVAATLDGHEITEQQIDLEFAGAHPQDPKAVMAARARALQAIIAREVLAKNARDQRLDKTPEYAMQEQRADETLLVQALEKKLVDAVPVPSREEAERYVADHPELFAERKVYQLDQIRFPLTGDPALIKGLKPLTTLDDVAAYLQSHHIDFRRGVDTLNSLAFDPKIVDQINKLPPHEVFILPLGGMAVASQIRGASVSPVAGDTAIKVATQLLLNQRRQASVQRALSEKMAKAWTQVKLNKSYQVLANPKSGGVPAAPNAASSALNAAPNPAH